MEPYLRKLGLHTQLNNAIIHLNDDFLLAQEGAALNAEQCKILVRKFKDMRNYSKTGERGEKKMSNTSLNFYKFELILHSYILMIFLQAK